MDKGGGQTVGGLAIMRLLVAVYSIQHTLYFAMDKINQHLYQVWGTLVSAWTQNRNDSMHSSSMMSIVW